MTTFALLIWVAYAGLDTGGVALDHSRFEFFTMQQCQEARTVTKTALEKEFKRVVAVCVSRPLPDEGMFDPLAPKKR
jgi:hypothetical protein